MANAFLPHHSKVLTQLGMNKCYHYIHHMDVESWRFAQQPRHSCSSLATYWPRDCRQVGLSLRSLQGSLLSCWMGVMWDCQPHSVLGTIKWDSANKIPIFCTFSLMVNASESLGILSLLCLVFLLLLLSLLPVPSSSSWAAEASSPPPSVCDMFTRQTKVSCQNCRCVWFSVDWPFSVRPAFLIPQGQCLL